MIAMKIVILGSPVPQARPHVVSRYNRTFAFDPSAQKKQEALKQVMLIKKDLEILKGPLECVFHAYMPIPKSLSKKKQQELIGQYHIKKPDWDNLYKFAIDILEGICFNNDSQICKPSGFKKYDLIPRVEIIISEVV